MLVELVLSKSPSLLTINRIWDQKDIIEQLLKYYDKLDDDIKADLPLKRIWTIANPEAEEE